MSQVRTVILSLTSCLCQDDTHTQSIVQPKYIEENFTIIKKILIQFPIYHPADATNA